MDTREKKSSRYLLLKRMAGFFVKVRYRKVPKEYVYFYRDTIVCKLVQFKYIFADYIFKKKYKNVSYEGEFGAELMYALPFAYWHYKNGTLKQTKSFKGTREFYFFSPDHQECFVERTNEGNYNYEIPRILYSQDYNIKKWMPVPLKNVYKNDHFHFEKPILIIANRFNSEWDGLPISYFSIEMLDFIISTLNHKYTIIYNRPRGKDIVNDNSQIYDLNEYSWLREKHPYVLQMNDLYDQSTFNMQSFNHFQLMVYSSCINFISVHGGTSTLASYFGGKNLIFSQQGGEHYFHCFEKLYPQLSGAQIIHAKNEEQLREYIVSHFQ